MDFLHNHSVEVILAALLALSEALALIPAIKANSIFEMLSNLLQKLAPKK